MLKAEKGVYLMKEKVAWYPTRRQAAPVCVQTPGGGHSLGGNVKIPFFLPESGLGVVFLGERGLLRPRAEAPSAMSVAQHLQEIRQRIAAAAQAAGRDPATVHLVAVSKTKPLPLIEEALAAGQLDFGENRVQEMEEKQPHLPQARWHLIGSLQRNKVKYIAPYVHLIHSVDSARLLAEIDKQAAKAGRQIDCLLQLNISEEDSKSGLDEARAEALLRDLDAYPHVRILGLMGMAALTDDEALVRSQFRRLRLAAEAFAQIDHPRLRMDIRSMGMSGDFELAIAEGATHVRIGSAVFGSR